jgi:hypothetical protein
MLKGGRFIKPSYRLAMAMTPHRKQRARAWLGAGVVPLLGALGSCGQTSTSQQRDGSAGVAAAAAGTSSAATSTSGAGTSSAGTSSAGTSSAGTSGAETSGAGKSGHAGEGAAGAGGAGISGGGGGDPSVGGAAGADSCVDVCGLYGETCCTSTVNCVSADASCIIEVFNQPATTIENEYPALEQLVASLPPSFRAWVSTADIVSSAAEPFPASRIELHLSAQASSRYGAALEAAVMDPFRISCAGQSLFVGQVYFLEGAQAIETPVLHVSRDADDAIVLRLGARQGAWSLAFPTDDIAARLRIDRPELRSTLCLDGALQKL